MSTTSTTTTTALALCALTLSLAAARARHPPSPPSSPSPPSPPQQQRSAVLAAMTAALDARREAGSLRRLPQTPPATATPPPTTPLIDLSSNDYASLARSPRLRSRFVDAVTATANASPHALTLGSTGSRLLSGDSPLAHELESFLADFHDAESALLFNSGYDANVSVLACVPPPGSAVLYDELVHASMHEGIRHSRAAETKAFKHNDLEDLARSLRLLVDRGFHNNIIIAVESVYSMDGHVAPLKGMEALARAYGAEIIVDEAHGTGVFGTEGRGVCDMMRVKPLVRVHTFGKALGCHGAVVVGPAVLKPFLSNYAKPLIYSTSLPPVSLLAIREAYAVMREESTETQATLQNLVRLFRHQADVLKLPIVDSPSPIQAVLVPGNARVVKVCELLRAAGFLVLPVRYPTVPRNTERIRVVLHAHNTEAEVVAFTANVARVLSDVPPPSSS